jgi:hypothetical protein
MSKKDDKNKKVSVAEERASMNEDWLELHPEKKELKKKGK